MIVHRMRNGLPAAGATAPAWSIQAIGNPKGTLNTFLNSVSCGGPSLCCSEFRALAPLPA